MKEPYKQGIANQFGRESCASLREETGEALTAGSPGQPLNSEIMTLRMPTLSCHGEGHTRRSVLRKFLFDATESETLCMDGNSHRGNRETSVIPCGKCLADGTVGEGPQPTSDMYVTEESDDLVVPEKRANKAGTPVAESVEERRSTKGNEFPMASRRTPCRKTWIDLSESRTASRSCRRLTVTYPR